MHHRGKIPINWQRQKKIQNAIFRLGRDLENAIEQENYEKAGHLKKVMEKLRSQLK
jgi:protein-arginine kinase activator protein McsA